MRVGEIAPHALRARTIFSIFDTSVGIHNIVKYIGAMSVVYLGEAKWTLAQSEVGMTVSALQSGPPGASVRNSIDVWTTPSHDFHLCFHTFFADLASISCSEGTASRDIEMHANRAEALLGSSLTQAPVGGSIISNGFANVRCSALVTATTCTFSKVCWTVPRQYCSTWKELCTEA